MAVNACEETQDAFCIFVSPAEGTPEPRSESALTFLSYSGGAEQLRSHMCLEPQMKCENNVPMPMEKTDVFPHCILDMGIDNGDPRMLRNNNETIEKLKIEEIFKNECPLTRVLQRQISLPVGKKLVQLFMNDRVVLPKFNCTAMSWHDYIQAVSLIFYADRYSDKSAPEKVHETPTYRSKKYKRSTSFSSRKVVLLFSVLSSLGTLVLIYLTLRVRQLGDNYLHT